MINCDEYDNMFTNIDSIKYINIYNLKNDKIISQIFNEKDEIFVCQKNNIIINHKAYNCCNCNSINDVGTIIIQSSKIIDTKIINNHSEESTIIQYINNIDTEIKIDTSEETTIFQSSVIVETDSSSSITESINISKQSSGKISIGVIIGITAAVVVVIIIITVIIIRFCKKRNKNHLITQSNIDILNNNNLTINNSSNKLSLNHKLKLFLHLQINIQLQYK